MNYLFAGNQTEERLSLLLSLTRIDSVIVVNALHDHLVVGHAATAAALINDVPAPNFNRALKRLNEAAATVEQIKELDWAHLQSVK